MSIMKDYSEALDNKRLDAIATRITALEVGTMKALVEISAEYGVEPDPVIETFIDGLKMFHVVLALSDLPD